MLVLFRTSGTEPKVCDCGDSFTKFADSWIGQIKYYLEGSGKDAARVATLLSRVVRELADDWMEADKNNLGIP